MKRILLALAATVALATPAAADWSLTANSARVTEGGRTFIISCDSLGRARVSTVPGPRALAAQTGIIFGFSVDGGSRIDVPFQCSASDCSEIVAPNRYTIEETALLMNRIRAGNTLQILFNDRVVESFGLRGSSAALNALEAANPGCRGL